MAAAARRKKPARPGLRFAPGGRLGIVAGQPEDPARLDMLVARMDEAPEYFAVMRIYDGSEVVEITRDLSQPSPGDAWDPMLRVVLAPKASRLHPGDPRSQYGGDIENIRASELRRLAEHLVAAIAKAEAAGVIPPDLTDAEWQQRYEQARAAQQQEG